MTIHEHVINDVSPTVRILFLRWRDFMYRNVKFNMPDSPIHSMEHCERVLLYGLLIGEQIWEDDEIRLTQIAQAAVFHDSRRLDEYLDTGHGARASVYYKQFCENNNDITYYPEVVYMMRYHDLDDSLGIEAVKKEFGEKAEAMLLQYQIFKDADALDRWRLGRGGLDEKYLRTSAAKKLVSYSRQIISETMSAELLTQIENKVHSSD